jgi:hypothetical protein
MDSPRPIRPTYFDPAARGRLAVTPPVKIAYRLPDDAAQGLENLSRDFASRSEPAAQAELSARSLPYR